MLVVWVLCAFVAWAAQRATIGRVRAANAVALEGVFLMVPRRWPIWLIILSAPLAAVTWLIKWGVILWGTISLEVDPELKRRFFEALVETLPPDV